MHRQHTCMTRALYTCIYVYMCAFDIGACARSRICVHVDALSRSLPQDTGVTRVATAHHDESGARGGGGLRHHTPTGSDQRYEECVKRGVSWQICHKRTSLFEHSSYLWSDPVGVRRRRAKRSPPPPRAPDDTPQQVHRGQVAPF